MKIHPRHELVSRASKEYGNMVCDWMEKHNLTFGEMYQILALEIASLARSHIQQERRRVGTKNVDKFKEEE